MMTSFVLNMQRLLRATLWQVLKLLALAVSEIFQKQLFCDGEVGDGGGGVNPICSRLEVADDFISGEDADLTGVCPGNMSFS